MIFRTRAVMVVNKGWHVFVHLSHTHAYTPTTVHVQLA